MQSSETLLTSINLVLLLGGLSGERNYEEEKKKKGKQRRKLESEGHVFPVWRWSLPMLVNCPCLELHAWAQKGKEQQFGP